MLHLIRRAIWLPCLMLCALSLGCTTPQPAPLNPLLPERVELADVPFFRISDEQGGASAVAALLNYRQVVVSPGVLSARMAQLGVAKSDAYNEANLSRAVRSYDLLVYPVAKNLTALLQQVSAGEPVLVKLQEGFAGGDTQYATVVGFDQRQQLIILRAGHMRRWHMPADDFSEAWSHAGKWAVLIMPTHQLPPAADRELWLQGARDLEQQGHAEAAQRALRTARTVWPEAQL